MIAKENVKPLVDYLPELQQRRERLTRFWAGEDIGRPPISIMPANSFRQKFDINEQFDCIVPYIIRALDLPGDYVPNFWPDTGTTVLPSVFGGEFIMEDDNNKRWIKPVLKSLDEVDSLEKPNALSGLVQEEFERCCRWRDLTDGQWPVSPPDMQGPVMIASMLMDQTELIIGMYEKPDQVRKLLRLCTDVILDVLELYDREFGDAFSPQTWPHVWFPATMGFTLTQDSIPVLSPEFYREFELPLVREISQRRGGLYIHCCGTLEHALDELARIPNLFGMDHSYPESNAEVIIQKLGARTVITSGRSPRSGNRFPRLVDYYRYLIERVPPESRIWFIFGSAPQTHACLELLGLPDMKRRFEKFVPVEDG